MVNFLLRLEFDHVFPEEKAKPAIEYLQQISKETLLNIIGFSNILQPPNYDNFHSNLNIRYDVINRVNDYGSKSKISEKPQVISRETSVRLAEIILSNKTTLLDSNTNSNNIDSDEMNLFKSFLVINKEINEKQKLPNAEDLKNIDVVARMMVTMSFASSDMGIFQDNNLEFGKLIYSTLIRFDLLIQFLASKPEYSYLEESLIKYFNLDSIQSLHGHIKHLYAQLLSMKFQNSFKFVVDDDESKLFLDSLASEIIIEDDDFTNLKNFPIYKFDAGTYSIIDYFFTVDKFYKSVRFILQKSFNYEHNLQKKDRRFFAFFNKKFSEEVLMKTLLDELFNKKYFIKLQLDENSNNDGAPDYYSRHNKKIFLFECKDALIPKDIKSSSDIYKILNVLKEKYLKSGKTDIGIGQLVNSICQIVNNNFPYDNFVNTKNNLTIYPILLVSDRILEIPGVNYILNQWYLTLVKEKLGKNYNPAYIKDLTLIDIDTIIFQLPYFLLDDKNFKDSVENHLRKMSAEKKAYGKNEEKLLKSANINLMQRLSPFSARFSHTFNHTELLLEKLKK